MKVSSAVTDEEQFQFSMWWMEAGRLLVTLQEVLVSTFGRERWPNRKLGQFSACMLLTEAVCAEVSPDDANMQPDF